MKQSINLSICIRIPYYSTYLKNFCIRKLSDDEIIR